MDDTTTTSHEVMKSGAATVRYSYRRVRSPGFSESRREMTASATGDHRIRAAVSGVERRDNLPTAA